MRQERISLTITVLTLICVGIVMIYSASCVNAMQTYGDSLYYLKRHMLFLSLGLVASFFVLRLDYRRIQPYARQLIGVCVVLLFLVLIPHIGNESYGARRWFKIGVFHFQPSELAKLALIIYTADFLARKQQIIKHSFVEGSPGILEIRAPRGRGMPYRFSRLIADQGWNVISARVGQWAGSATAAFYLLGPKGQPLSTEEVNNLIAEINPEESKP